MEITEKEKIALYRGRDIAINEHINIHVPTLDEIFEYGEREYFSFINTICSVGADLKWQLDEIGIDYTKVEDFELFSQFLINTVDYNISPIIFGNILDFKNMRLIYNEKIEDNILVQHVDNIKEIEKNNLKNKINKSINKPIETEIIDKSYDIVIDKAIYSKIVSVLRYMHGFKRNNEKPMNEMTRQFLIDEAKENYEINKDKPYKSQLFDLISTMVNTDGFKHDEVTVFNMNIVAFFNSVKRIQKIKKSDLLLQSGYSGFGINLKEVKKEDTDMFGKL